MARQLPAHLSHKSALVLLPPSSITAPIESVRRTHDKHFLRWPPHINLLYPFLASPSEVNAQGEGNASPQLKDSIRARVQQAIKPLRPFQTSLSADPPGSFTHSKRSRTVWLGPSSQSVQQLQAALQAEFAECNADPRPFTPHLSIGQANSGHYVQKLGDEIRNSITAFANHSEGAPVALDWYVDKVFVIERKGFHGRFEIIGSIDIDKE
jgi:2'-5' RNA ligase